MLHATNDQAPARPQHKKRDADDFTADIRAKAVPIVEQSGLNGTTHPTNDQIIAQAHEAAERLIAGHEWQDWVAVGRALRIGRSHALYEAGTNKPEGKKYAGSFARWLTEHKLDRIADKATRCRLLELMDHVDQVETWRKTLPINKRLSINHPITVWKHWQRSKVVPDPSKAQKPSPFAAVKQSLIESQEEVARLTKAAGGNLFTRETSAKDFVRIVRETFTPWKVREIRKLLEDDEPARKPSKGESK